MVYHRRYQQNSILQITETIFYLLCRLIFHFIFHLFVMTKYCSRLFEAEKKSTKKDASFPSEN